MNTRNREIRKEEATEEEMKWGGRLIIAKLLLREVPPYCAPTGRRNKLVIASGLLADTPVTTSGRLSLGGKSPLTGGAKESSVGGHAGKKLARLGIRAVVIEDTPNRPTTSILVITANDIKLVDAPEMKGLTVSATFKALRKIYGPNAGIICIGPAGEFLMYSAGIAVTDDRDIQVRYAARGGLGALMGSKGIKAIVVDDAGAPSPEFFDELLLVNTARDVARVLAEDPKTQNRHAYGTPAILRLANQAGLLPTRNFSSGQFELADQIDGERVAELIAKRQGEGRSGTPCVKGCIIQCSNVFPNNQGAKIVASLQYESIVLLGSNCGIGNLDDIAELNDLCNQVGVDTIETGAAIGVAMEAGVIRFGDAEGAKDLIRQIGQGTYLGRILGHGAALTGRVFGVRRVPVVKGQAIPGYDPRALKGNGVTYATSPMGADHTAGNAFETLGYVDPLGTENQVATSRKLQVRAAILDSLGLCLFARPAFVKHPEYLLVLLKARYGWDLTVRELKRIGEDVLATEREFNRRNGVCEDVLPEFMTEEPLPPNNSVFDIPAAELEKVWTTSIPGDEI